MGSEWQTFSIEEIAERTFSGPFGSNVRKTEYVDSGVPVIRGLNLSGTRFDDQDYVFVSKEKAESLSSSLVLPKDVVFVARGTVGLVGLVPETYKYYLLSPNLVGLRTTRNIADPLYVFYYFRSRYGQNEINSYVSTTGVPKIARALESMRNFKILLPPLPEQQAIAHILGSLDDKIELNHRMNKTLEAIARAIFKSWFIDFDPVIDNALRAGNLIPDSMAERAEMRRQILDQNQPSSSGSFFQRAKGSNYRGGFDFSGLGEVSVDEIYGLFPDSFQDSKLGAIPKGWIVGKVSDFANVTSGKRPQKRSKEKTAEFNIPLYGGGGVMAFVSKPMIKEPFLLTGRVGTLSKIFRITEACWPSDNTLLVFPKDKIHLQFLFFMLQRIDFDSLNRGSTQPLITQTDLQNQSIIIPSRNIMNSFLKIVYPLFEKIDKDILESNTLASLRDALLPKLISGELRVPDAVAIIKGVEL
jgi:type I restriction enzyme S subunit